MGEGTLRQRGGDARGVDDVPDGDAMTDVTLRYAGRQVKVAISRRLNLEEVAVRWICR
jgi:hypothetical protein